MNTPRAAARALSGLLTAVGMTAVLVGLAAPAAAAPAVRAAGPGDAEYIVYSPPPALGQSAVEPSIGVNWASGAVMYQADTETLRVVFDDSKQPAMATWSNHPAPNTTFGGLDPILFTDSVTGRTFVSQLTGVDSLAAYSDDDGSNWTPSQGGGIPSGVDHQTIGGGPYHAPAPPGSGVVYPRAVYYCSQAKVTAFCARSDNGGLTFGVGFPIYTNALDQCGGLHGHVRVAADGTAYVPNQTCNGKQAVSVSTDNGFTWTVRPVPDSKETLRSDPSLGIGQGSAMYFAYENGDGRPLVAVTHDRGLTWSPSVDVGAPFGIKNSSFQEMIAGDDSRGAYAFLGSSDPGDPEDLNYKGAWYLYLANTYDGGKTWDVRNVTPNDPVERGCIYLSGKGTCTSAPHRNLLDFNDITVDRQGRPVVGYADGCTGACDHDPAQPNYVHVAQIARLSCGRGLFAARDADLPACPGPAAAAGTPPSAAAAAISPPAMLVNTSVSPASRVGLLLLSLACLVILAPATISRLR